MVLPAAADIVAAAELKSVYQLSYADAFAVVLALREDAPVMAGDPEIRNIANKIGSRLTVDWLGTIH